MVVSAFIQFHDYSNFLLFLLLRVSKNHKKPSYSISEVVSGHPKSKTLLFSSFNQLTLSFTITRFLSL
ncbi:hypothetical protein P8452_50435 [Trifolium repens]|nr:hypothetical protein P8452_50435 [Trifolium repens]